MALRVLLLRCKGKSFQDVDNETLSLRDRLPRCTSWCSSSRFPSVSLYRYFFPHLVFVVSCWLNHTARKWNKCSRAPQFACSVWPCVHCWQTAGRRPRAPMKDTLWGRLFLCQDGVIVLW